MKFKQSFLIVSSLALLLGAGCMGGTPARKPIVNPSIAPVQNSGPAQADPATLKPGKETGSTSTGKTTGPEVSGDRSIDSATGFQGGPPLKQ